MTDKTIQLDRHRGMAAQKATELRRLRTEVEDNERSLRRRRDDLEAQLLAAPSTTWREVGEKARYLLTQYAATASAQDSRQQTLIKAVLDDLARLSRRPERSR
jgi:hypothetical protein